MYIQEHVVTNIDHANSSVRRQPILLNSNKIRRTALRVVITCVCIVASGLAYGEGNEASSAQPTKVTSIAAEVCGAGSLTGTATAAATTAIGAKVVVATWAVTAPSAGIAGWLGFTTTAVTVISLPVAGIIITGGLLAYGACSYLTASN